MSELWHYTCDHGHTQIRGFVVPASDLHEGLDGTPGMYAWFTDLAAPERHALGLTSYSLGCDRTAHRYRVLDDSTLVPWVRVRRSWPSWQDALEGAPGARPMHWFVTTMPVPVEYAPLEDAA